MNKVNLEELFKKHKEKSTKRAEQMEKNKERNMYIVKQHLVNGRTLADIGQEFGISRQRVHTIVNQVVEKTSGQDDTWM